jgi:replicative superfamily II helicase
LIGKEVVELTGDVTPDIGAIQRASVIVTTPEKWDGISRYFVLCNLDVGLPSSIY